MTDIRKIIANNLRSIMGQEDITPAMLREWTGLDFGFSSDRSEISSRSCNDTKRTTTANIIPKSAD